MAAGSVEGESLRAHRLDAFVDLLAGAEAGGGTAAAQALVLIDAAALRRGALRSGDTCEIDGVGPVSLEMATELLDEASVQFLVKTGRDIATVSSPTRTLPRAPRWRSWRGIVRARSPAVANASASRPTTAKSTTETAGRPRLRTWSGCARRTTT